MISRGVSLLFGIAVALTYITSNEVFFNNLSKWFLRGAEGEFYYNNVIIILYIIIIIYLL